MTSSVKINAHCDDDVKVVIEIRSNQTKENPFGDIERHELSHGKFMELHVFGDRSITIREVPKA